MARTPRKRLGSSEKLNTLLLKVVGDARPGLARDLTNLARVLSSYEARPKASAPVREKHVGALRRASKVVVRYAGSAPVNLDIMALVDSLESLAASIESDTRVRGGQRNELTSTLAMGMATAFQTHGVRVTVSEGGVADRVVELLVPLTTGRRPKWSARREYLREALAFSAQS